MWWIQNQNNKGLFKPGFCQPQPHLSLPFFPLKQGHLFSSHVHTSKSLFISLPFSWVAFPFLSTHLRFHIRILALSQELLHFPAGLISSELPSTALFLGLNLSTCVGPAGSLGSLASP